MLLSLVKNNPSEKGVRASTRDRLISAAATLFQQRGYHSVSTNEILALAGSPRGSLYHHFPRGKAQLAETAVNWLADEIINNLRSMRLRGDSPTEIITRMINKISQWLKHVKFTESPLFVSLTIGLGEADEALAKSISDAYLRIQNEYSQMFTVAGLSKADAEHLALSIISSIEGGVILCRAMGNVNHLQKTKLNLINLLQSLEVAK